MLWTGQYIEPKQIMYVFDICFDDDNFNSNIHIKSMNQETACDLQVTPEKFLSFHVFLSLLLKYFYSSESIARQAIWQSLVLYTLLIKYENLTFLSTI